MYSVRLKKSARAFIAMLCLFTVNLSYSQTAELDSLKQLVPVSKTPEAKAELLYRIGFFILYHNTDSSLVYAKKLEEHAEEYVLKKPLGQAYDLYSMVYGTIGEPKQALEFKFKQMKIWEETKDTGNIVITLREISDLYADMDRSSQAMESLVRAIDWAKNLKSQDPLAACYNSVGRLYSFQYQYKKAVDYFNKALAIRTILRDTFGLFFSYGPLGDLYINMEQYDSAIVYSSLALDIAEKYDRPSLAAAQYNAVGIAHLKTGRLEIAKDYFEKGLKAAISSGNGITENHVYLNLSVLEHKRGNNQEAMQFAQKAVDFGKSNDMLEYEGEGLLYLAHAYAGAGKYVDAYETMLETFAIRDTLFRREDLKRMAELETKYDTEQKEIQLAQQELIIARQQNAQKNMIIAGGVGLLLLGGFFQYFRNRQKLKQQEAELALQLKKSEAEQLRKLDEVKSNFFANISHEFRTPLTLILGPLEQMMQNTLSGSPEKYYRIMHRNGTRLLGLVNQLLDLSRIEGGKMELRVSKYDLNQLVKIMAYSFESQAEQKQINLVVKTQAKAIEMWYDQDKMEKILTNLLSNAFKFTADEGRIEVTTFQQNDHAQVIVSDNGIGMSKDQQLHIFDRFFKTGAVSDLQASSGIGLALTKELVELHNGKIEVQSEEDAGTRFIISLPIGKTHFKDAIFIKPQKNNLYQNAKIQIEPPLTESTSQYKGKGESLVLVVEDNEDVRNYIVEQIQEHFKVVIAENGKTGMEKALKLIPDLIISDLMMPEVNGIELCKQVKANEKTSHIPIIMLTAKSEKEDKLTGLEVGADDYLIKPFDKNELLIRAKNLIRQRKTLQAFIASQGFDFKPSEVAVNPVDKEFLKKVKTAIEESMDEETFGVVDLGKAVNMSRSQLHRKLKAMTGKSPNEIIREMRLARAKEFLEKNAGNASEVAFMVGFNSVAYFSKCFKDQYGFSPSNVFDKETIRVD